MVVRRVSKLASALLAATIVAPLTAPASGPAAAAQCAGACVAIGSVSVLEGDTGTRTVTLPVTLLTLGLFIFVINGLMFLLAAKLLDGFLVDGIWAGVFGSVVYSLISWALTRLLLSSPR